MSSTEKPRRFSQYADSQLPTDYAKLETIEHQEVTVVGGRVGNGKFGAFAVMDIMNDKGEIKTFMTSGFLVVDALNKAILEDAFPLLARFERPNRCWRIE